MSDIVWASCDPGMRGCVIIWRGNRPESVHCNRYDEDSKMPDKEWLEHVFNTNKPSFIVIEKVNGIKGQAAGAAFNFGLGTGCIHGYCMAKGIKIVTFSANYWMNRAHKGQLKSIPSKQRSINVMMEKYASWADLYQANDGVADALCIGLVAIMEGFVNAIA